MLKIPKDRFIIIAIVLFLMWLGFMIFFYLKADEITHSPCEVCAKKLGNDIFCTTGGVQLKEIIYHPNMTTEKNVRT